MRKMTMPNFCINFLIKQRNCYQFYMISLSHPSRMRGLKLLFVFTIYHTRKSHPSWMRGLKLKQEENQILTGHVASLVDAWIKIMLLLN